MQRLAVSDSLVEWIFWMVIDVLNSGYWRISYRHVFYDTEGQKIAVFLRKPAAFCDSRYIRMDACVFEESDSIFIDPEAEDKPLCLFHECLEILFAEWKEEYYLHHEWGLREGDDPILFLESATWDKLDSAQKETIARYLPKSS